MLGCECEYLTGVLMSFMGPQVGCWISWIMLRARTTVGGVLFNMGVFLGRGFRWGGGT